MIHDRKSDTGEKTVTQLRLTEPIGVATVTIPRRKDREVDMEVAYRRVTLKKPKRIVGDSPEELEMTLVRIGERGKGKGGIEWKFLYRIGKKTKIPPKEPYPLSEAVRYLAEPGSYRRAPSDGPPGLKSVWQGLFRLFETVDILVDQV